MVDIRELYDINGMYANYINKTPKGQNPIAKKPIDKQRLIEILRKTESLDDYLFSIAELTSFLADCLDGKVMYKTKHNKKDIRHTELLGELPFLIAFNIHNRVKAPKKTAYEQFYLMKGYDKRHVRAQIDKNDMKERFELEIAENLKFIAEEEQEQD